MNGVNSSCVAAPAVPGCTDATACNYNANATTDDGSCILPDGCTDPLYLEYDATAQCDDGSCATLIVSGCMDINACNYDASATVTDTSCVYLTADGSIRTQPNYVAGTGFSVGAFQTAGTYTPDGWVLADQFQINLEYNIGVDTAAVDLWNDWGDVAGGGANPGANWHDPQYYVLSIDTTGGLTASQYTGSGNAPLEDYSENLEWTITGWSHTILGGYIDGNRLVVHPPNTYRPFDPNLNVNVQEQFDGLTKTELTALTFTCSIINVNCNSTIISIITIYVRIIN